MNLSGMTRAFFSVLAFFEEFCDLILTGSSSFLIRSGAFCIVKLSFVGFLSSKISLKNKMSEDKYLSVAFFGDFSQIQSMFFVALSFSGTS